LPAPNGLIGWWPADGNAVTIVGTNNGTLQGGATATNVGFIGNTFTFDGTNNFVQIADSPILHPTNFTVEAWIRFTGLDSAGLGGSPAGDQYIFFHQNTRNADFEGIDLSKTRIAGLDRFRFLVSSATGQFAEMESTTVISTGVWYHVAAVRGSNFTQLYINGVLEVQTNVAFAQDYGAQPLFFGTSGQSFWDHKFKGNLDEVSFYNRPLSSSEISAIFLAGSAGKCKGATITTQPQGLTLGVGANAQFTVSASGIAPLAYQWRFNGANVVGATNTSLTITNIQPANGGNYTVVASNFLGSATSSVAVLAVLFPPGITSQPLSRTNVAGTAASFSVVATGTPAPGYQWQFNGANISGATDATLLVSNVQAGNAGNYSVVVTNLVGAATSSVAVLTVWFPPAVGTQPASRTNVVGTTASFSVNATGTAPLSYQWQFNGANIGGATGSNLTLDNVQASAGGNYAVVVTNVAGTVSSSVAVLTVWTPPAITTQPLSRTNITGADATFNVIATGTAPLSYQWQFGGNSIAGATASTLTVNNVQLANAGNYAVVVTNVAGSIASAVASLTVWAPPAISIQPTSTTNLAGASASFSVTASGTAPLSYQWQFAGNNIAGATASSLTLNNVQLSDAGNYSVAITNVAGSVTSSVAVLTIWAAPAITTQPSSRTNITGSDATFTVNATGTAPLSYQWQFGGNNISGATTSSLTLNNVQLSSAGDYSVVVTNIAGSLGSAVATLTVWAPPAITIQPLSRTNLTGTSASFSVTATGTAPLSYQWLFGGGPISGATTSSLTLNSLQLSDAGNYTVAITNVAGSLTSSAAALTIWAAPAITAQPQSATNIAGTTASFSVSATGTAPLSYQWQFNGVNLDGANGSSLSLNNVQPSAAGNYTVAITNVAGAFTSATASLTVWVPPFIATPPISQTVIASSNALFNVVSGGTLPLSYQWLANGIPLSNGGNISGATTATLNITGAQPNNAAAYTVVITNVAGTVTSSPAAVLTVNVPPSITLLPQAQTVIAGSNVTISVSASGTLPLTYQWRLYGTNLVNGGNVSGVIAPNLTIAAAQPNNAGPYTVVISNVAATLTSSPPAELTVNVPPSITTQPQGLVVLVGSNVTFTVGASGTAPLSYQWRANGINLVEGPNFVGTTTATLNIPNAQQTSSAAYSVLVTNAAASVLSSIANLLVINPDVVVFCDTNLEDAVRIQLGKPVGDIFRLDLINLYFLCAPDSHITCLGGLEWATNLTTLYLGGNLISDLSVLTNCSRLTNLFLAHNLLRDLSPLSTLTNLTQLDARFNPTISNFASVPGPPNLTEAYFGNSSLKAFGFLPTLSGLKFLSFEGNPVSNITALATLPNLKGLDLGYNLQLNLQQLSSLSGLTSLYLSGNGITNLTFLQNFQQLTNLSFRGNAVTDATPLSGLSNLRALDCAENPGIVDFSPFSSLTNLETLSLSGNSITNLAPLQSLSRLSVLNLDNNLINTLSPIAGLTNLGFLSVQQNLLTSSAGLGNLTNLLSLNLNQNSLAGLSLPQFPNRLNSLSLSSNRITSAQPLASLTNLQSLNFGANPIADYSGLVSLSNLNALALYGNSISNISFLQNLRILTSLDLHGNLIADVSLLGVLTNLSEINLAGNLVANPSALASLGNLSSLDLSSNPIANWNPISSLTNLSELYVQSDSLVDLSFLPASPRLEKLDITLNRITNAASLSALKGLHYLLAGYNRLTEISNLSDLPRLWYADVRTNLLDISPNSDTSIIISDLASRMVAVDYVPQNQPPTINLPAIWPIAANVTSAPLAFDVSDDVTASNLLMVTAVSSNLVLIPNSNIALATTSSNRTLTVTPVTGKTGNTLVTVTVTDETALSTMASVLITVVAQQNVTIPDVNLRAAVRAAIGKPSGALNNIDLLSLNQLTANFAGIADLTGLEWASNLTSLSLAGNSVSNLARIQNLPSLRTLTLDSNPLSNLSQLAIMTNLVELSLVNDSVSNVAFLNNLTGLSLLNLNNNLVADVSPISFLNNLNYLFLGQNLLTNISPLLNLPRLTDTDVTLNLLDTSSGSLAMAVISTLQSYGTLVLYLPQRSPPGISAPTTWRIPANTPSYLTFNVLNSSPPAASLTVTAASSNNGLIPNTTLSVFQNPNQSWTLKATPVNQSGNVTITLNVSDNFGLSSSQPVAVTVVIPGTVPPQVLNNPNLSWITWGNAQWFSETAVTHDGVSAAQSGDINDNQESWLGTTVAGPGRLSFWWRVSSEPNFDFLQFYINNVLQANNLSGEVDWQQQIFNVPPGTNTLRWRYVKDQNVSDGADAGWLDEVNYSPGVWLELLGPPVNGQAQLVLHAIPGNPYEVQVSTNLVNWTQLILVTPTNTATPIFDNAAGNGTRFYRLHDLSLGLIYFDKPTLGSGSIRLVLHSPTNLPFRILTSTNLKDWSSLATVTNTLGTVQFTNNLSSNIPRRFYRAQLAF
jgi:Leucine-rich repeat (LRR) protein